MPGRNFSSSSYRYGFNGKENDRETVGTGNGTQDYGMRIYNPSLGRFLSTDPLQKDYPFLTPYQFASNTPIQAIDLDGLEQYYYLLAKTDGKPTLTLTSVENDWVDRNLQEKATYITYGEHTLRFTSADYAGDGNAFNYSQMGSFMKDPDAFIAQADKDRTEFVTLAAIGGALGLSEKLSIGVNRFISAKQSVPTISKAEESANQSTSTSGQKTNGTMSNKEVRQWYSDKVKNINTNVEANETNARAVVNERNSLKQQARDMMSDRKTAADLDKSDPIQNFDYYNKKYSGDYSKIIKGGTTPNADVNKKLDVK